MSDTDQEETIAAQRYMVMNLIRIIAIFVVITGIASAQGALPLPYALGVVLAVGGLVGFFFLPPLMVRRWKEQDRLEP